MKDIDAQEREEKALNKSSEQISRKHVQQDDEGQAYEVFELFFPSEATEKVPHLALNRAVLSSC